MPRERFEYFTISIGLRTESTGEIDREEVFAALRDVVFANAFIDDDGIAWDVYSLKDES